MHNHSYILERIIFLGFFITFFSPFNAHGRPDQIATGQELSDETMLFQEIPSIFGASKYEQKVSEAPSSVSIVTAEEIKKYGYRTLTDIVRSVRGLYATNDRSMDYLGIRGFNRPGDYNTRVLVLIDGHRINDNLYDSGHIGLNFPVDVDLIQQVEIIRGPSSSLYGTNAFFGVINVITKRGRDFKGLEISGEACSYQAFKERLTYGNRYENGLEMLLSGSNYDSDGQDYYCKEFDDPATNNGVAEDCDAHDVHNLFSKLTYHDLTFEAYYLKTNKGLPTASWGTIFNDPRTKEREQRYSLDLKYNHLFENELEVLARLYHEVYDYGGEWIYDYPPVTLFVDDDSGDWWGGELQLVRTVFDRHKISLGGEYRLNRQQEFRGYDKDPFWLYLDEDRHEDNWGIYMQDEISILNNLIFNAGVRYDHYGTFGGTTHPRLALIYNPYEKTTLKFLYGEAFRAPNAYELYYSDEGETSKSNPDLDPEMIETWELVWEQYLGDHLRAVASGFHYNIEDLITATTDPSDDLIVYDNTEEIEAKGIELELEGKWASGLEGRVSYSFQETENQETGKILTNSPKHLVKLNMILPIAAENIFVSPEVQYTSKRKTLKDNYEDDFFVTNLTLFSRVLLKGLEVSFSIYNLFDKSYGDPGSEEHIQDTLEQEGRIYRLKLTYFF